MVFLLVHLQVIIPSRRMITRTDLDNLRILRNRLVKIDSSEPVSQYMTEFKQEFDTCGIVIDRYNPINDTLQRFACIRPRFIKRIFNKTLREMSDESGVLGMLLSANCLHTNSGTLAGIDMRIRYVHKFRISGKLNVVHYIAVNINSLNEFISNWTVRLEATDHTRRDDVQMETVRATIGMKKRGSDFIGMDVTFDRPIATTTAITHMTVQTDVEPRVATAGFVAGTFTPYDAAALVRTTVAPKFEKFTKKYRDERDVKEVVFGAAYRATFLKKMINKYGLRPTLERKLPKMLVARLLETGPGASEFSEACVRAINEVYGTNFILNDLFKRTDDELMEMAKNWRDAAAAGRTFR